MTQLCVYPSAEDGRGWAGSQIPIDTLWDAANVVYDIGKIRVGYATGNTAMMVDGSKDLAMDTGALLIPYVPAGASKLLKVGIKYGDEAADSLKAFDKANDARKAAEAAAETKKAADAAEAAKKASDAAEAAKKAEQAKAVGSVPKPSTGKGTAPPSQRNPQRALVVGRKNRSSLNRAASALVAIRNLKSLKARATMSSVTLTVGRHPKTITLWNAKIAIASFTAQRISKG